MNSKRAWIAHCAVELARIRGAKTAIAYYQEASDWYKELRHLEPKEAALVIFASS